MKLATALPDRARWSASCGLLEALCLTGVIDKITMQPPHRIVAGPVHDAGVRLAQRRDRQDARQCGLIAFGLSLVVGIDRRDRASTGSAPVRETLDPLFATYYAIPIFAFYPLLIILFGLGDAPQIFIGAMLGVVGGDREHAERARPRAERAAEDRAGSTS